MPANSSCGAVVVRCGCVTTLSVVSIEGSVYLLRLTCGCRDAFISLKAHTLGELHCWSITQHSTA